MSNLMQSRPKIVKPPKLRCFVFLEGWVSTWSLRSLVAICDCRFIASLLLSVNSLGLVACVLGLAQGHYVVAE